MEEVPSLRSCRDRCREGDTDSVPACRSSLLGLFLKSRALVLRASSAAKIKMVKKRGPRRGPAQRVANLPHYDHEAGVTVTAEKGIMAVPDLGPVQVTVTVTLAPMGPDRVHANATPVPSAWSRGRAPSHFSRPGFTDTPKLVSGASGDPKST